MDSLLSTSRVLIFRYANVSSERLLKSQHVFPVEPGCRKLHVLISGPIKSGGYTFTVHHEHDSVPPANSTTQASIWMHNVLVADPRPGNWLIYPTSTERSSNDFFQVSVFCESDSEVSIQFYTENKDLGHTFLRELETPLVANSTVFVSAQATNSNVVLQELTLSDSETDRLIGNYTLQTHEDLPHALAAQVVVPSSPFNVRVIGQVVDTVYRMARVLPSAFVPVRMELELSLAEDSAPTRSKLAVTL